MAWEGEGRCRGRPEGDKNIAENICIYKQYLRFPDIRVARHRQQGVGQG